MHVVEPGWETVSHPLRLRDPLRRDIVAFVVLVAALGIALNLFTRQVLLPAVAAEGAIHTAWVGAASLFGGRNTLQAGVAGVWFGIVVLWAVDTYKRTLAVVPFLFGLAWAALLGVSPDAIGSLLVVEGVTVFVIFALATVQVGGIGVLQYARGGRLVSVPPDEPVELRNGPRLLFLATGAVVLAAVVDHHVTLTMAGAPAANATFWNAAYGVAILGLLYPFVRYDNRRRVVQIGPGRSGKTSTVGGMYCDVKQGSRAPSEDRTGRQLVGNQLRGISDRLTNSRSFPNRTQKTGAIPFDYFDSRRLFRRKNVMMTFDYEGQRLTGENGPEESFSAKLETYRNRRDEAGTLARLRERVSRALGLDTDPWYSEFTGEVGEPNIAKLLDSADTVLFTLPLDDFLTPSFERRGEVPSNAGIYLVEPVDGDEERYTVARPWGEEFEVVRSSAGDLLRADDGAAVEGLAFDSFEELAPAPGADGPTERRYTTDKDRAPIGSYLDEYRRLIDLLWESESRGWLDTSREFVWVPTMSDLVYDDFAALYGELTPRQVDGGEASGTLRFLWEHGLFEDGEPEHDIQDYTLFGQWIVDECVQRHVLRARESVSLGEGQNLPDVDELIARTGEDSVYPVWFDVSRPDDALVIEAGNGRLLNGSDYLFDRIEGRPLPRPTYRRYKSSAPTVAYQWLNPLTTPTGKPFYDSAVAELDRRADYDAAPAEDDESTAGTR